MIAQKPLPRSKFASVAERLFFGRYTGDVREIAFRSADVAAAADELGYAVADQLGDFYVAYGFQQPLPRSIRATAPRDFEWRIMSDAPDHYRFALRTNFRFVPDAMLAEYKVNDVTGCERRACGQMSPRELLDVVHANRLVENFSGLRLASREIDVNIEVPSGFGMAETIQVTIADLIIGESWRTARYIMPCYVVSNDGTLNAERFELCINGLRQRYPDYICLPLAVQGLDEDVIVLCSLETASDGIRKGSERHCMLIRSAQLDHVSQ